MMLSCWSTDALAQLGLRQTEIQSALLAVFAQKQFLHGKTPPACAFTAIAKFSSL
jgi:hypothetical protein